MAQPALKLDDFGEKLNDFSRELSDFEIRRMLMELERATKTLSGPDLANTYSLMGMAQNRLGRLDRALIEFKKSARIHPVAVHKFNLGRLELSLGHLEEAVDTLAEAVELDSRDVRGVAHFAEALFRLGSLDDAREVFEQAIAVADLKNGPEVLTLAIQAAILGADAEAIELYARFLALCHNVALGDRSAVDFLEQHHQPLVGNIVSNVEALNRVVERAILFGPSVEHLRMISLPTEPPASAAPSATDETAEQVLAWMAPHRARANAAALPEGDGDE